MDGENIKTLQLLAVELVAQAKECGGYYTTRRNELFKQVKAIDWALRNIGGPNSKAYGGNELPDWYKTVMDFLKDD